MDQAGLTFWDISPFISALTTKFPHNRINDEIYPCWKYRTESFYAF